MSGETGVDWRFVLTSSRGDVREVINERARIPENRGVREGHGEIGGSTTLKK